MLNCLAINRIVTDNSKSPMYVAVNYMSCMQCKYNYRSFQIQSLVKLMRLHCTFNSHCTFACTWVPWRFCFNAGILKIEFSLIECAKLVSTGRNSIEKNKSSGKCFFLFHQLNYCFNGVFSTYTFWYLLNTWLNCAFFALLDMRLNCTCFFVG